MKLKLHHNKNRLGLRPRPQWGSLQCSPIPPSWISIYWPIRLFGPLLSGLYCRLLGPPLWVIRSSFWFSNVGMSGDTDSGFSPYDTLESLVSYEVIWCLWVRRLPLNEGIKEGYPHLEIIILPRFACLAWKRLQIDTDLLLIITSTVDELSGGTKMVVPWTTMNPPNKGF